MLGDELIILHNVAARLESAGIAYMVTGSLALAVYAEPRMRPWTSSHLRI
jgi:hypothetical protein